MHQQKKNTQKKKELEFNILYFPPKKHWWILHYKNLNVLGLFPLSLQWYFISNYKCVNGVISGLHIPRRGAGFLCNLLTVSLTLPRTPSHLPPAHAHTRPHPEPSSLPPPLPTQDKRQPQLHLTCYVSWVFVSLQHWQNLVLSLILPS